MYAALYVFVSGPAYHGGEAGRVFEDVGSLEHSQQKVKTDNQELKGIQLKAGNVTSFKVSKKYKSRCASCHGVNGRGSVGSNLFGQNADEIYTKLMDYKKGIKENVVMEGLLLNMKESELKELSIEIGAFRTKANNE